MSDECQVMLQRNRRNLQVVRADRFSVPLECAPDLSAFPGACVIERQRRERREEHIEFCVLASRIGARFSSVAEFVHDHRTENDVRP